MVITRMLSKNLAMYKGLELRFSRLNTFSAKLPSGKLVALDEAIMSHFRLSLCWAMCIKNDTNQKI